ncbi:hypothetical protein [Halospeciosus flavus]|uniref:Uncharacterized protein n=1 Tax=Halospeciosus flavus TaxID=3032283 RepID=A0ABD5Z7Z7_9EURY|nr:hypothetical protein [Halospeciosus flavus]
MAGEFYDALGTVTGYALELGDDVRTFQYDVEGTEVAGLRVDRNDNRVRLTGFRGDRSFLVEYVFRVSDHLDGGVEALDEETLDRAHEAAAEAVHDTDASIRRLTAGDGEGQRWDGYAVQDRLYPFDAGFGLREYNETVKGVVRAGVPVARAAAEELDAVSEDVVPGTAESEEEPRRIDRMYE